MLNKFMYRILVLITAAAVSLTVLAIGDQSVEALENTPAESDEELEGEEDLESEQELESDPFRYGWYGMGMHRWWQDPKDTDGDGYPDLPEGVNPPWDADGDGEPDDSADRPIRGRGWCHYVPN